MTIQLKNAEKLQKVIDDVKEISSDAKQEIIDLKLQVEQKDSLQTELATLKHNAVHLTTEISDLSL